MSFDMDATLIECINNNDLEGVESSVSLGADVNIDDGTPIVTAALGGKWKIVAFLLEKGADVHSDNDIVIQKAKEAGQYDLLMPFVD